MNYDVVVVGGGLVGVSAALALHGSALRVPLGQARLRVALVEQRPLASLAPLADTSGFDTRVYAITPASRALLSDLGAWQQLPQQRIAPIQRMQVWGDGGACIEFDAFDSGAAQLACIVEHNALMRALLAQLQASDVQVIAPAQCDDVAWGQHDVQLSLADGSTLSAQLLIAADGGDSWLRQQADIEVHDVPYPQQALVANFATEREHGGAALQWFGTHGVLAWLPLPGRAISIVWSAPTELAQTLLQLDSEQFCQRVAAIGAQRLGDMQLLTKPAAFALRNLRAQRLVQQRLALIGDAGHCIHPLAGQGLNIGFKDVAVLTDLLRNRGLRHDCGEYTVLRRYERARKEEVLLMQGSIDGLYRLFAAQSGSARRLRNWGLAATNQLAWLKKRLASHAMG